MGHLVYGSAGTPIEVDDRALAHLQAVILAKLRRREGFAVTLDDPASEARRVVFLSEAIPIEFDYSSRAPQRLNRRWVEALLLSANSTSGLVLSPEPSESEPDK